MKSLFFFFLPLFFTTISNAGEPARLGPLLIKAYPQIRDYDESIILIYFVDKGNQHTVSLSNPSTFISERSINRRLKARGDGKIFDERDIPLERSYVDRIKRNVVTVRHELKWFNAVSVVATKMQIEEIRRLPFVKEIDLVGRWKRLPEPVQPLHDKESPHTRTQNDSLSLDYGSSFTQNNQINVPAVHDFGVYGQGVVVGVFDNGFRLMNHASFDSMNIIAQHDFVDHKESVIPDNPSPTFGSHGVNTLSTIGGFAPGFLIGPAFKADFILARTENDSSETPIEEDNWAAAIQWADSIGVDVTSTSLIYAGFDPPYIGWTWADMNGNTTLITKAADHAVELGIVVLNSAGNAGGGDGIHNTLGAPADGDSVIAVGAVGSNGLRVSFSSVGPTSDGRFKPDIMAMGSGVTVASSTNPTGYGTASGTSFSCPLSGGVAALMLSANPSLTPVQVREALRQTANNSSSPNNLYGWGIINALEAINYYGPTANGSIGGIKFNDMNGNGTKEPGEPPIEGAEILLSGTVNDTTLTDIDGNFLFSPLPFGNYSIKESVPVGWLKTTPADSYAIKLLFDMDTSGFAFGNFQLGAIHGSKYYDIDKDSTLDSTDVPLANWKFILSGPTTAEAFTDSFGNFTFSDLGPGTYTVSESSQVYWMQSYPQGTGMYEVTMQSGLDTNGLLFLNFYDDEFMYAVASGWNLLSLPQAPLSHLKDILYPSATSQAFRYNHGYYNIDTLNNGSGYWLKFNNPQNIQILGSVRLTDSIDVVTGWNIVGSLSESFPVSSVVQDPPGILETNFFSYQGAYAVADSLHPHAGYWVKANNNGRLYFNTSAGYTGQSMAAGLQPKDIQMNTLRIIDGSGGGQTLFFTNADRTENVIAMYSLPPLPPDGGFDIRFANGGFMSVLRADEESRIQLSSVSYPVKLMWNIEEEIGGVLDIDGELMALIQDGSRIVSNKISHLSIRPLRLSDNSLPEKFGLEQNFPNPFNPSTIIRYQLPQDCNVQLRVLNVFGQEVATLVNGFQESGFKSVEFDAAKFASGMYFYVLSAGGFRETRKMIVLK